MVADRCAQLAAEVRRVAHSAIPVTDDSLCDESSEVILIVPANTLNSQSNVGSGDGVVANTDIRTNEVGNLLLRSSQGSAGGGSSG